MPDLTISRSATDKSIAEIIASAREHAADHGYVLQDDDMVDTAIAHFASEMGIDVEQIDMVAIRDQFHATTA